MNRFVFSAAWLAWILVAAVAAAATPHHHVLQVNLDPAASSLEVLDVVRLPSPQARDPLLFLLHSDLVLSSVSAGQSELVTTSRGGFEPRRFWRRPDYEELSSFAVARQHEVAPPPGGWPQELTLTFRYGGAVLDSLQAPAVAYGRSFQESSGLITEEGAYLAGSSFWVPWFGDEFVTFDLTTTTPADWRSVSQGRLAQDEETPAAGTRVMRWVEDNSMEEIFLVAGPYQLRQQRHGSVQTYTFTYSDTPEGLCRTYLDATGRYLDLYSELLGPYPYEKFALVENFWQTGYGMPSFTLLGDKVLRLPFIVDTSYGHEILHNWWGNGVYVDRSGGNWCEGLTTYLADHLYKEQEGPDAARDYRRNALVAYLDFAATGDRDLALRSFRERSDFATQAVGYGKTMMVFHMLRRKLGDELFFQALRRLYTESRFGEAGWDAVATSFSSVAGIDLGPWFAAWIDEPGAPALRLVSVSATDKTTTFTLEQSSPPYPLEIPVRLEDARGQRTEVVSLTETSDSYTLEGPARWITVDPDFDLFRKMQREEIPPTLSLILGAARTAVVLGEETSPEELAALRGVAERWARNQDMIVVEEAALDPADLQGRSLYVLGNGPLARGLVEELRALDAEGSALATAWQSGRSVVAVLAHPQDPERSRALVLAASATVTAALGRKLPHYGRYSWLEFDGESNVGKGTWSVTVSPMRRAVTDAP